MTTPETASNFLLVTMDSVRRDYLGCYGGSENSTPHIDALSRTSLVFDQAITNGSYTKTAFPPILSSTYASSHSGPFADVGRERPMLASVLKDHGFATAGFTANPLLGAHLGYDAGFDRFEEPVPPPDSRRWLRLRGAQRVLRSSLLNSLLRQAGVETRPHPVYVDGSRITDSALEWLQYQNGRFFLWVHYMDAHWPYHVPAELRHGGACAQAWRDLQIMNRNRKSYPGDAVVARIKALYRSGISRLDREVGRLLDYLDTTGRLSQTVVAVTADHGEAFYEHGRWQHGA
ncbi:MAG TPA: sulfatase, partial [Acidobacteriota bacterium]|nr:sulfatase [Acidobacteriota bacterium]